MNGKQLVIKTVYETVFCVDRTISMQSVLNTLAAQKEVFANAALVIRILAQTHSVGRVHGATVVDSVAEQQTVGDVDVLLTHSKDLALDHWKTAIMILLSTQERDDAHELWCNLD